VVDYIVAPVNSNTQTDSYMTTGVPMPCGPLLKHYMGVLHYGPGSAPKYANTGSDKSPLNLHF
jgi:hypothetical protein